MPIAEVTIYTRPPQAFGLLWRDCGRRNTSQGPRYLYEATPTDEFSAAWKRDKARLRDGGYAFGRDIAGDWAVNFWARPSAEATPAAAQATAAAVEASRATDADVEIPAPAGREYLPYQRAGIAYAVQRDGTLLGDEMGLGKTVQTIGVANADGARTILILCPASLKLNWRRELDRWLVADLPVHVVEGGRAAFPDVASGGVVVVNYDVLHAYVDQVRAVSWDLMVGDEAHFLKEKDSRRTRAAFGGERTKTQPAIAPIAAKRRLLLTGTPMNSRPKEIFSLLHYLDPQAWPDFWQFARRYCAAHRERNGFWYFDGAFHQAELQEKLRAGVMVRRLKADVLTELPAKIRQVLPLPADTAALRRLLRDEQAAHDRWERLRDARDAGADAAFEELSKLREQVGIAKAPLIAEHILQDAEPVVAFAHHRSVVEGVADALWAKGRLVVQVTGDMDAATRQASVDAFQEGRADVILGTLGAMGVGLTLIRSAHVVIGELDWVPSTLSQAEDRCHRIGQVGSVHVEHLVFEGSLDSRLVEVLIGKQSVLDAVLDHRPAPAPVTEGTSAPSTAPTLAEVAPMLDDAAIAEIEAAAVAAVVARRREREEREAAQRDRDATSTAEALAALRAALATSAWALGASTCATATAIAQRETLAPWEHVRALELIALMDRNAAGAAERVRTKVVDAAHLARAADPAVRALALEECRRLAGLDADHAEEENGVGYGKDTSSTGHALAAQDALDEHDAAVALAVLWKHKGHVYQDVLDMMFGEAARGLGCPRPLLPPVPAPVSDPVPMSETVELPVPPVAAEPEPTPEVEVSTPVIEDIAEAAPARTDRPVAQSPASARLERVGEAMYGSRWQTDLAEALGVNSRTVRRWASGETPVPDDLWPRLTAAARARQARIDAALGDLGVEAPVVQPAPEPARDVAAVLAGEVSTAMAKLLRREAVQAATIPAADVAYLRAHHADLSREPIDVSGLVMLVARPDAPLDVVNRVAAIVSASVEAVVALGEQPAWVSATQADAAIERGG